MDIAITGHRPKDLGRIGRDVIMAHTMTLIRRANERWPGETITLHTGAAIGVDLWVAEAAIAAGVRNHLHPPLKDPAIYAQRGWTIADADLLKKITGLSDVVCQTCPRPVAPEYQRRNEHMVDSSRLVIAFWTGKRSGGTYNCIQYAKRMDVPVLNALDGFRRI